MATSSSTSEVQSTPQDHETSIASRIECPVCCDIFRSPKCLTCGHSVCAECCQKLLPLLGNSIACPVCRSVTAMPPGGLPTNFALQKEGKDYQCVECDRLCTADEAWLSNMKMELEILPRCFRCIIKHSHGSDAAASTLPTSMESVSDTFKRYDEDFKKLKKRLETFSNEQRDWTSNVRQAVWTIRNRADDIVQASQTLAKATLDDVDKLHNEFQYLNLQTNSAELPTSLEDLNGFHKSIQDTTAKLDRMSDERKKTMTRTNVTLNSLAIGLDCLLHVNDEAKLGIASGRENEGKNDQSSDGDGGLVTPPQERTRDQQNRGGAAAAAIASSSGVQSTTTPNVEAAGVNQSTEMGNVFSLRGGLRPYRVYAVRVSRRGRGRASRGVNH